MRDLVAGAFRNAAALSRGLRSILPSYFRPRRPSVFDRSDEPRILLVIHADAAWHSTVIFTAQMLSEQGAVVEVIFRPYRDPAFFGAVNFGNGVRLYPCRRSAWKGLSTLGYIPFLVRVYCHTLRFRPDCIIGYDLHGFVAAFLASLGRPSALRIYHNFDLSPRENLGPLSRFLKALESAGARRADWVVASSEKRAVALREEAGLIRAPLVVRNCQRLGLPIPSTGEREDLLERLGSRFERLVVRLGALGPGHGIEATIRSVCTWKGEWGLILAGATSEAYLDTLRALVRSLNLDGKVVFLPSVPRDLWYTCLYSADLGIALYEPGNVNHASMAGAGNKLNLYLRAGIPSIVPALPDFEHFARQYGGCEVAEPTDPASVARAVNAILCNPEKYARYCKQARRAFEKEFNFEKQFTPLLAEVLTVARRKGIDTAMALGR